MPLVTRDSTQANVFIGSSEPTAANGDLWSDTGNSKLKRYNGTSFDTIGSSIAEMVAYG